MYKRGDDFGANTIKIIDDIPMATENDLTFYPFDRCVVDMWPKEVRVGREETVFFFGLGDGGSPREVPRPV